MITMPNARKRCRYCAKWYSTKSYDKNHGDNCKLKPKIDRYLSIEGINKYKNTHDALMEAVRSYYNAYINFLKKPNPKGQDDVIKYLLVLKKSIIGMKQQNKIARAEMKTSIAKLRIIRNELKQRKQNGNNSSDDATSI